MRTLKLAIVSLALLPSAASAAAVTGLSATFKGKTSQGEPVVIHVVKGVVQAPSRLTWSYPCDNGTVSGVARLAGRLNNAGGFAPGPLHDVTKSSGLKLKQTATVRFKVRGQTARGSFVSTTTVYPLAGGRSQRCSQKVTFTARR